MTKNRPHRARTIDYATALCLVSAAACAGDDGPAQATDSATTTLGATTVTTTSDESTTTATSESTSTTSQSCPEGQNVCGGCQPLPAAPGAACNGCELLVWECDGLDALRCVGADPAAIPYWPDADDDGYGDASADPTLYCDPPGAGWSKDNDDCADDVPTANPDGKEICNGIDDNCDGATDEGPPNTFCADVCCEVDKICDGASCVDKCPGGELCGADLELCCQGAEECYADACVVPGDACEFAEECAADELCPGGLGKCVPAGIVPECEFIPEFGPFSPSQGCRWTTAGLQANPARVDVVATPIVINLSDDNGDGETNDLDTPEIAFLTYDFSGAGCCNVDATLRVVSGECNDDKSMKTLASISSPTLTNDAGIAAGDLDGDGVPELVAITKVDGQPQGTVAFKRTTSDASQWEVLWHNTLYPRWNVHTRGGATISLADLDGDGTPEVVIGNVALDGLTGDLVWDGVATAMGKGGIGNNGFLGPSSTVADIDLDGFQEVIAGNTVYAHDGATKWQLDYMSQNSPCGGALPCDGFNAVGNFDEDDRGEVVIVRLGEVFVVDDDGTLLHKVQIPKINCAANEAGPPTIADFDGDGRPEIGTASADYYVVVDLDCIGDPLPAGCQGQGILWQRTNVDCTSRVTASSVFDFEGDGKAEVVYADEVSFRVFDGTTGQILFSDNTYRSHTRIEMPVIADVDRDGSADIVIGENRYNGGQAGLEVWKDPAKLWVRTRRVWNQHGYYITNISKDGAVPAAAEKNWLNDRFNNFRQNVQPGGLFEAPDAVIPALICDATAAPGSLKISVVAKNDGAEVLPAATKVRLELVEDGEASPLIDLLTSKALLPGQFELMGVTVELPKGVELPVTLRATIDSDGFVDECKEENNVTEAACFLPG
jgi:hypothetical protein